MAHSGSSRRGPRVIHAPLIRDRMAVATLPLAAPYLPYGKLKVFFGNMFSGKTDELHHVYDRARHARVASEGFKPRLDTRDRPGEMTSRRGRLRLPMRAISEPTDVFDLLGSQTKIVLFDEIQFFDRSILQVVQTLRLLGIDVAAGGLDLDYLARPFGATLELAARATEARKLTAICHQCRYDGAEYTQMIDARTGDAISHVLQGGSPVFVEGVHRYEARCGRCYVWPEARQ